MKTSIKRAITLFSSVIFLLALSIAMPATKTKAANPVSYIDFSGVKEKMYVDGKPFFYNAVQISPHRLVLERGWNLSDCDKLFNTAKNDHFTVISAPILWWTIEGAKDNFNWSWVDHLIDQAELNNLKLELLWFGSSTCGGFTDAPSYVQNTYQSVLKSDGGFLKYNGNKHLDFTDPNLLAREAFVINTMMNHVADYISAHHYSNTVVGIQLLNEPSVIGNGPFPNPIDETAENYTDRSYSTYANAKWTAGGYTSAKTFCVDVMYEYLNGLAKAVKTSNYSVWTRTNIGSWFEIDYDMTFEVIKKKEDLRAAGQAPYLDLVGDDPYNASESFIYDFCINTGRYNYGKNLAMVMENNGSYANTVKLIFNAFAADGLYHIWELNESLAGGYEYGMYNTDFANKTISAKPHVLEVRNFNSMLNKDKADLAKLSSVAGEVRYFNRTFAASDSTNFNVGSIPVTYTTANGGGGIGILRDPSTLVFMSTTDSKFSVPNDIGINSLQKGYFDNNNNWVSQGDVSYITVGNKLEFDIHSFECIRAIVNSTYAVPTSKTNLAASAKVSIASLDSLKPAGNINDGNLYSQIKSKMSPILPQYITFQWDEGKSFDTVVLYDCFSLNEAPTSWDIEVSNDGISGWTTVSSVTGVNWSNRDWTVESYKTMFKTVSGKKGLRIKINAVNMSFNYFTVSEIEIFDSHNLACSAAVQATGFISDYSLGCVNDNRNITAIQSVDNPVFPGYITFTWDTGKAFDKVSLTSFFCQGQAPTSFEIEVSDDGIGGWTKVASTGIFSWNYNNSTYETKEVLFKKQINKKGLRVKILSAHLQWSHYAICDIGIFDRNNLAFDATASATVIDGAYPAATVNDGNLDTAAQSLDHPGFPQYITLNWDSGKTFSSVFMKCRYAQGQAPTNFEVQVSVDGTSNWITLNSYTKTWATNNSTLETADLYFTRVSNMKGVRIKINNANLQWNHYAVNEIEVY